MPKPTARKIAFTKAALQGLPVPAEGRVYYHDERTAGLCLAVTATGTRTFYVYKWHDRPVRIRLGRWPVTSIDQARKLAEAAVGDMAKGKDVAAERRDGRHAPTLGDAFAYFLEYHSKPHKRSWERDEWEYDRFLQPWASRRLTTIKRADVQALHARIGQDSGHYAANRLLSLLSSILNKATDIGFKGENPCRGVQKFKETPRDRFLHGDEAARFFAALAEEADPFPDIIAMLLLTGARKGNVLGMRWLDLNLAAGLWRIPGEVAKAGEVIVVPLLPQAVAILERRRYLGPASSMWVFPSTGRTGHLVEVRHAWARIVQRAELSDLRPHDLRRTLGSHMAMQGASLLIVGKALGHRQPSTTAIYARLQVDPVRAAMTAGAEAIFAAVANGAESPEALALPAPDSEGGDSDGQS